MWNASGVLKNSWRQAWDGELSLHSNGESSGAVGALRQEFCLYQCSNSGLSPGTRRLMDTSCHGGVSTGPSGSRWGSPRIVWMDQETADGMTFRLDTRLGWGRRRKEGRKKKRKVVASEWLSYLRAWTGCAWWHQVMCHPTPGWVRFSHAYLVYFESHVTHCTTRTMWLSCMVCKVYLFIVKENFQQSHNRSDQRHR